MTNTTDALKRAIAYLGAVQIAPDRYAWKAENDASYATASSDVLATLDVSAAGMGHNDYDAYQRWIATADYTEMPSGWTPTDQDAYRCPTTPSDQKAAHEDNIVGCGTVFFARPDDEGLVDCPQCGIFFPRNEPGVRITANLATGEELPA